MKVVVGSFVVFVSVGLMWLGYVLVWMKTYYVFMLLGMVSEQCFMGLCFDTMVNILMLCTYLCLMAVCFVMCFDDNLYVLMLIMLECWRREFC
jgi:hypothetical protein